MSEHKHATVVLHMSHPEGVSHAQETALDHAATLAIEFAEANGFEVHYAHTHTHGHGTKLHRPPNAHHHADHKPAA